MSESLRLSVPKCREVPGYNLNEPTQHAQAEIYERASQLAKLHERRDREIVEIQRYETVQGLVYQDAGVNRFQVYLGLLPAARHLQACSTRTWP